MSSRGRQEVGLGGGQRRVKSKYRNFRYYN